MNVVWISMKRREGNMSYNIDNCGKNRVFINPMICIKTIKSFRVFLWIMSKLETDSTSMTTWKTWQLSLKINIYLIIKSNDINWDDFERENFMNNIIRFKNYILFSKIQCFFDLFSNYQNKNFFDIDIFLMIFRELFHNFILMIFNQCNNWFLIYI